MNTIRKGDVIQVKTQTGEFQAMVESATNNGLSGVVVRHAREPHTLMSHELSDRSQQGRWILDEEEDAQLVLIEGASQA